MSEAELKARAVEIYEQAVTQKLEQLGKAPTEDMLRIFRKQLTVGVLQGKKDGKLVTLINGHNPAFEQYVKAAMKPGEEYVDSIPVIPDNLRTGLPRKSGHIHVHSEQVLAGEADVTGVTDSLVGTSNSGCQKLCISNLRENYSAIRHVNPSNRGVEGSGAHSATHTTAPDAKPKAAPPPVPSPRSANTPAAAPEHTSTPAYTGTKTAASEAAKDGTVSSGENAVERAIAAEIPRLPAAARTTMARAIVQGLAKHGPSLGKGFVVGILADVVSTEILHANNEMEEQADAIDRANGVPPTKRDDTLLHIIPFPPLQIAAAIAGRIGTEVLWRMTKGEVEHHREQFEKNSGLTPKDPEYGAAYKAYSDMEQSMFQGDWDKYIP